ncbi:hypothetical protein [Euzebya sp.]|uniref:hypothetical protein n=1 Tax=Euzebya sp. TaxID=1971409 RepID=UPI0035136B8C
MISISTRAVTLTDADQMCRLGPTRCGRCRRTTRCFLAGQRTALTVAGRRTPAAWRSRWYVVCGDCGDAEEISEQAADVLRRVH